MTPIPSGQELGPGTYQWFHQPEPSIGEWVTEASDDGPWRFASHSDSRTDPTYDNPGPNREKALSLPGYKYFCRTWNWQLVPRLPCGALAMPLCSRRSLVVLLA